MKRFEFIKVMKEEAEMASPNKSAHQLLLNQKIAEKMVSLISFIFEFLV